jgi:hypothetical protein
MRYLAALPPAPGTGEPRVAACAHCGRMLRAASGFVLGGQRRCLWCAVRDRPMLRRSAVTALVVGTVLVAINQVGALDAGQFRPALQWQIPLTFTVPFLVASWGALSNSRISMREPERGEPGSIGPAA